MCADYGMEEQPFEVHLFKGPQGLGMSLTGGEMGGKGRLPSIIFINFLLFLSNRKKISLSIQKP